VLNPDANGNAQPGNFLQSVSGGPSGQTQAGSYQFSYNGVNTVTATFVPSNGGAQTSVSDSLLPGGTNNTLIPGLTLTAMSNPPAGSSTDTLQFNVSQEGVLQSLNSYLSQVLGSGGIFDSEKNSTQKTVQNLNDQVTQMNKSLDTYRQTLQAQFTAMEASLAALQAQSANLISMMGGNSSSSSSSTGMSSGASSSASH
jgi:flagellar hook-associated protein 2